MSLARSTPPLNIDTVIAAWPATARRRFAALRNLLYKVAAEEGLTLEETLKWGEPSYLTRGGSTIRIAWKTGRPLDVTLFFNCQTSLVETIREIYGEALVCEGNRAVHVPIKGRLDRGPIAHCLLLALTYHGRKHLPLLGA